MNIRQVTDFINNKKDKGIKIVFPVQTTECSSENTDLCIGLKNDILYATTYKTELDIPIDTIKKLKTYLSKQNPDDRFRIIVSGLPDILDINVMTYDPQTNRLIFMHNIF